MTPRDRLMIAAQLKEPDQVPVTFLRSTYDATRIGLNVKEYIFNYKKKLNSQIKLHERFPGCAFIPSINPDFGIVAEASGFGAEIIYYENEPPMNNTIVNEITQIDNLKIPDPYTDGLLPKVLEAYKYLIENTPSQYKVDPSAIRGPMDLATAIRGVAPFLSDMYKNPGYVHKLMNITTQTEINFMKAMDEISGGSEIIFMCDDIPGLISPNFFKEFALPYMKKIFNSFKKKVKFYHNCKGSMHILEQLIETGFQVFNFSFENDLEETKKRIGQKVCLMGNVEPIGKFRTAKSKEIENICKHQIETAAIGGAYTLSVGAAVYGPDSSMQAMIDAAEKYGKYPIRKK
jgi:uroporphyrinogen decarboxylase